MTPMTTDAGLGSTTVLGAMLRHKVTVIVCLTIGVLGGLAYAAGQPRRPAAAALLVVRDPHATGVGPDGSVAARYTADQANLMRSPAVATNASRLLAQAKRRPSPESRTRLLQLIAIIDRLSQTMDPSYVPLWLSKPLVALGDEPPLVALGEGRYKDVSKLVAELENDSFS